MTENPHSSEKKLTDNEVTAELLAMLDKIPDKTSPDILGEKGISIEHIARMNREYLKAAFTYYEKDRAEGGA